MNAIARTRKGSDMIAVRINGNEYPNGPIRLEIILVGNGNFYSTLEYEQGGVVLIRQSESRQVETFIPYHRVWEIETIRD
jgi:hypothetical protein